MRCARLVAMLIFGCATTSSGDDGSSEGSATTSSTTAVDATTSTSTTTSTSSLTTTADDESSTGAPIDGYPCSVQVVTQGALYDPLVRGDGIGMFPPVVADTIEDACGCHTLTGGAQNVAFPGLQAPGGTLFVDYADLQNAFEATTLGAAIESEVRGFRMPPGSCPKPPELADVLIPWLDQGMPDGATFVP